MFSRCSNHRFQSGNNFQAIRNDVLRWQEESVVPVDCASVSSLLDGVRDRNVMFAVGMISARA